MIRIVNAIRTYPATPWLLENVETGRPMALCWHKEVAEALALFYNGYAAKVNTSPDGT